MNEMQRVVDTEIARRRFGPAEDMVDELLEEVGELHTGSLARGERQRLRQQADPDTVEGAS